MKKISITIHNGRVSGGPEGYRGGSCNAPMDEVIAALGGTTDRDEPTEEASLTETVETDQELTA